VVEAHLARLLLISACVDGQQSMWRCRDELPDVGLIDVQLRCNAASAQNYLARVSSTDVALGSAMA